MLNFVDSLVCWIRNLRIGNLITLSPFEAVEVCSGEHLHFKNYLVLPFPECF